MHCGRFRSEPVTRRQALKSCGSGLAAVALAGMLRNEGYALPNHPWQPRPTHFPAQAKSIIFLYMDGGPSQVDTFDYKPKLEKHHGENPQDAMGPLEPTQFNNVGRVLKSPWKFRQYGESGAWFSDLLPHLSRHADKMCFVRSMVSNFSEHTSANYFLHTGSGLQGRPSMGAWIGYGLGSENQNLPGFVVLNGGLIPPGGRDCFGSSFLPASYQGSIFGPNKPALAHVVSQEASAELQRSKRQLLAQLDQYAIEQHGTSDPIEAAIANYEMAYRMQAAVPELTELADERPATKESYGLDSNNKNTQVYGRQCLLARRLVERGVRFIELTCPQPNGDRWDQHQKLKQGHEHNCLTVDQPIAALLTDLDQRGLLDSTLVLWAGEFGRTPFSQGADGRDHNPYGFTVWMAGGGVKPGFDFGATDEWGYRTVENRVDIHDLHATMLHLLGLDHKRVTYRFSSRDMRLTDVHGNVIHEILMHH